MMKRYLAAVGVGGLVFAAALGSAAALQINDPGVAQYGASYDLRCDEDGVTVAGYHTEVDEGPTKSYGVTVSGIDNTCAGKVLVAEATDENGNTLRKGNVTINGATASINWAALPFSDLDGIQLTIG